jgi:hypothetical protein
LACFELIVADHEGSTRLLNQKAGAGSRVTHIKQAAELTNASRVHF